MKAALDFLSAPGLLEVLHQSERLRKLPMNHPAKEDRLQARAMLVYAALEMIGYLGKETDKPRRT
jgi:hypothetical protein